jgi:hypothetical protein
LASKSDSCASSWKVGTRSSTISSATRRSPEEAKDRYERLRRDERYRKLKPLARPQAKLGEEHVNKNSRFLRSPKWEATNNGAERSARAFRDLQAPHYEFRKSQSIDNAIRARAYLYKVESTVVKKPAARPLRSWS